MLAAIAVVAATLALISGVGGGAAPALAASAPEGALLAGGSGFSCAITASDGLACWGDNTSGQLGDGTTARSLVPKAVPGLANVRSVTAGLTHTCAATTANEVWCWGANAKGQLGIGSTTQANSPTQVTGFGTGVRSLDATQYQTCLVNGAGAVWCWGSQTSSPVPQSTVPVEVTGLGGTAVAVTTGIGFACALLDTGAARCWGVNTAGQLGRGAAGSSATPVNVANVSGATSIEAGNNHACVILDDASAKCWGDGNGNRLGTGTSTNQFTPVVLTVATGLRSLSAASDTCAIRLNGVVVCWGSIAQPVASSIRAIALTGAHLCVLTYAGGITCTGDNATGGLGTGGATTVDVPRTVPSLESGVTAVTAGVQHTCAIVDATARCWGLNGNGQLGNGSTTSSATPVTVSGLPPVKSIAAGTASSCAVTTAGATWCWGRGTSGQLGNGTLSDSSVPVPVSGLGSGTASVDVGPSRACAVSDAGAVSCWGTGYLGDGPSRTSSTPVPVLGLSSGATSVSIGVLHACAMKTDGGVRCWGDNTHRQLGAPSAGTGIPVDMVGLTSATAVSASEANGSWISADTTYRGHTCVIDAGAARCIGNNPIGQLGDGTTTGRTTLTQVSGLTSGVTALATSVAISCAVASGAGYCWPSGTSRTPLLVDGLASGVTAITLNGRVQTFFGNGFWTGHYCALADGGVKCWGSNDVGQAGLADQSTSVVGGNMFSSAEIPPPTVTAFRTPAANAAGWTNSPVTVSFNCASPALVSCTTPQTVSTDGTNQSVTGTATDDQDRSASTTLAGISIDRVAPTLAGLPVDPPNAAGWYKGPVDIEWSCLDDRSGVAVCPPRSTASGEGTAVSVTQSISDRAGNPTTAGSAPVKIDQTPPSTGISSVPGWARDSVVISMTTTDALSGVASTYTQLDGGTATPGSSLVVSGEGEHTVYVWSFDNAGNEEDATMLTIRIDASAPTITASVSPAPNANGWHRGPATVTFTCADPDGSGVASCTPPQSFSNEVDTVVQGTAVDVAGNSASAQATVRIDRTAPTVTPQLPPANAYGWYSSEVQVPFSCTDEGGSGVDTCPAPQTFAGEGAGQAVTGSATDLAGNVGEASGATVDLDLTAPTISGAVLETPNPGGGHTGSATVRWTCDDALSGVVSCPADTIVSGEGVHVVGRTITDRAGHPATAEVSVRIDPDPVGIVRGAVTDRTTGAPVAGVLVRLYDRTSVTVRYSTTTGTDGTYTFPLVDEGSYRVSFVKWATHFPAFYPDRTDLATAQVVNLVPGGNLQLDQSMVPGQTLTGRLTATGTGQPISGATVRLSTGTWVTSDATGRYQLTGLTQPSYGLQITAYGFQQSSSTVTLPTAGDVDRTLTATPATAGLKGRITTASAGTPIAGATVRLWMLDGQTTVATVATGTDGRYTFPALPAGTYQIDVIRGGAQRWAPGQLGRTGTTTRTLTSACTTAPDATWGDPCATVINSTM